MKKLLGVAAMWLVLLPAVVSADGMVIPRPMARIEEGGQRAVIWHDGTTETLILSTSFEGDAEDFAWVIPVPARPEVDQAKDELFTALEAYTMRNYQDKYPSLGGLQMINVGTDSYSGVTVVETKRVDIFDIAVLEAENGTALRKWLEDNGYEYPATKDHLLQHYIAKNWYFVAAKVSGDATGYAGAELRSGHATPLEIKFASKQIVYPLKISGPAAEFSNEKLIAAYGFEEGMAGWQSGILTTETAWQGRRALEMRNTGKVKAFYYSTVQMGGLKAGTEYVFSAYVKAKPGSEGELKLRVYGNGVEAESGAVAAATATEWQRLTVNFVAGGTGRYTFSVRADELNGGGVVDWDGIMIEMGDKPSEFGKERQPDTTESLDLTGSVPIVLYVFADNKKTVPGFQTDYAGELAAKDIERLAYDDDGEPWIKPAKKMYLTKLTRSMTPVQMSDDLIIREAADNEPVGGVMLQSVGWRSVAVLGIPVAAELAFVIYYWYSRRKKEN